MPSVPPQLLPGKEAKKHIAAAYDNYQRYQRLLETPEDTGWALVVLFYTALHLVQAHAVTKCSRNGKTPPNDHRERKQYIAENIKSIFNYYTLLQAGSESIRYGLGQVTRSEVEQYHDRRFENIRAHLASQDITWEGP